MRDDLQQGVVGHVRGREHWVSIVLIAVVGCLANPSTSIRSASSTEPLSGTYVLDTDDSLLGDTILAVRILSLGDGAQDSVVGVWERVDTTTPEFATRLSADTTHSYPSTRALIGGRLGATIDLDWTLTPTEVAKFRGTIQGDSLVGVLNVGTRAGHAVLRRLDLDSTLARLDPLDGWFDPGNRAVIALRLDDTRDSDRTLIAELERRQLKADIAVITQRIGTRIFLSWQEIGDLDRRGFGIVGHSRLHQAGGMSLGRFAWEVVGSKNDLVSHGLDPRWFAIVGSWTGPSYLDSTQQLRRARARVLRRYFDGTLAWVYLVPTAIPVPDSEDYGLSHINCDHFIVRNVMANIREAILRHGYLELSYHSYLADKSLVLPVWDSLALLRDQGVIVLASSAVGSRAARDGAPALIAAGGGPLESRNVALSEDAAGACLATAETLDSSAIALAPHCTVTVRLHQPPRGVAVALEAVWSVDSGTDTLALTLRDAADPSRSNSHKCVVTARESFCTVRLGVSRARSDVIAEARHLGSLSAGAFLKRSAVLVQ